MRRTIFDTPVISALMYRLALLYLKLFGWRLEGQMPETKKFVLIAAPHTSNWDLPVMLCVAFALNAKIFWMGKHTLFRWPPGVFFKWLGGIPINRSAKHDVVSQSVELFRDNEEMILAVPPEGTRGKATYWKTGFYYIASGAEVPILMGFIDYRRKTTGLGPLLIPTGNLESDMELIRAFYANITGKYPDKSGVITVAPK